MNQLQAKFVVASFFIGVLSIYYLITFPPAIGFDQALMVSMVTGSGFGSFPDHHILWNNAVLGLVLKALYGGFPSTPWYHLLLVFAVYLIASIFWVFVYQSRNVWAMMFSLLSFVVVYGLLLVRLNFTSVSLLLLLTGGILFCRGIEYRCHGKLSLGILLAALGFLVRWRMVLVAFALLFPLFIYSVAQRRRVDDSWMRSTVIALCSLFILFCGLHFFDVFQYRAAWGEYREFLGLSVEFRDRRVLAPTYPGLGALLHEQGLSRNDYDLFMNWFGLDGTVFNRERQVALKAGAPVRFRLQELWKYRYRTAERRFGFTVLALAPLVFLSCKRSKQARLCIFATAVISLLLFASFAVVYKLSPFKIYLPLFTAPILVSLSLLEKSSVPLRLSKRNLMFLVFAIVGTFAAVREQVKWVVSQEEHRQIVSRDIQILNEFLEEQKSLIVTWGAGLPFDGISAFEIQSVFNNWELISATYPPNSFPPSSEKLKKFGLTDAIRDVVDSENVLIAVLKSPESGKMNRRPELLEIFYRVNYQVEVGLEPVLQGETFLLYRVVSRRGV